MKPRSCTTLGPILGAIAFAAACASAAAGLPLSYPIVDTAQSQCYDNQREIPAPRKGQAFYGQDAQSAGNQPSYTLSSDSLTVRDNITGLVWQRSPDTNKDGVLNGADKLTYAQALELPAKLNAARFGGYSDWRLPSIKELYSLILFSGIDPSGPEADESRCKPFLDTRFFKFAYGKASDGERVIDSQYASSTKYVSKSFPDMGQLFGVNFADGRIKGYGLRAHGNHPEKTFFVQCVRGNPSYGKNDFHDNGDGTVSDQATGLVWSKVDSGKGMNWEAALAWVQARNAERYQGHDDWRLPNAKELQSIVDYTRSPDTSSSAAIDRVFKCTPITNEIGKTDFPFYWTSTTHASMRGGSNAVYIAFGRAAGWPGMPGGPNGMRGGGPGGQRGPIGPIGPIGPMNPENSAPNRAGAPHYSDVHGAGAQRSDPKAGKASDYPKGRGPQGDVVRIENFVRLVRGGLSGGAQ